MSCSFINKEYVAINNALAKLKGLFKVIMQDCALLYGMNGPQRTAVFRK